jgi:CRP/FNR family transcriptional regulator
MQTINEAVSGGRKQIQLAGEFFDKLSPEALKEMMSIVHPTSYQTGCILFSEKETPQSLFVVLEGEVKLSINSSAGKRLILRIVGKGEILGLASVLSATRCEMTAETLHPAKIGVVARRDFLDLLSHHPKVYQTVTQELSRHYSMACEQLRTVGLSFTAPEKLARLLLDWSRNCQTTENKSRLHFALTHEEIGEFIGATRETVSRTLSAFKHQRLVDFHGSTLTIPSRTALESYASC